MSATVIELRTRRVLREGTPGDAQRAAPAEPPAADALTHRAQQAIARLRAREAERRGTSE